MESSFPSRSRRLMVAAGGLVFVVICATAGYFWGYAEGSATTGEMPVSDMKSPHALFEIQGPSMAPSLVEGDICEVATVSDGLRVGDLVVVRWDEDCHLKRVAAVCGDVVDVQDGRLTVNGVRVEDEIASRAEGWFGQPEEIPVSVGAESWDRVAENDEWLIYRHRNPHAGGESTAVMDDYPENKDVKRMLNPVDRLVVHLKPVNGAEQSEFNVVFWIGDKAYQTRTRDGRASAYLAVNGPRLEAQGVDLNDSHPVAIQIDEEQLANYRVELSRQIEYRNGKRSSGFPFPLELGGEELYVVGDNVPVSVDSRSIGPVLFNQVVGKVVGKQ